MHHTKEHCLSKDIPAEPFERAILNIMREIVTEKKFIGPIIKQIRGNSDVDRARLGQELQQLRTNLADRTRRLQNLI